MRPFPLAGLLSVLLAVLLLGGCLGPVGVAPIAEPAAPRPGGLSSDELSPATVQLLRLFDLEGALADSPLAVIAILHGSYRIQEDPKLLAAEAEVALALARRADGGEAGEAWALLAAARSWQYLVADTGPALERAFDPTFLAVSRTYREAVGRWVRLRQELPDPWASHHTTTPFEIFAVRVGSGGPAAVAPRRFDRLMVAADLEIRGLRNRYRRPGLGAALVSVRDNRGDEPLDRYWPPEGIVAPLSAILEFSPGLKGQRSVRARFLDPLRAAAIEVGGRSLPLVADFTAPFAYQASLGDFAELGRRGLLDPGEVAPAQGIYLLEPYDPAQIPVLMVHGLRSSPLAWMELTNDLFGDEELRRSFQVWHYVYPTGLPFLTSGAVLRRTLEEIRASLDPEGDDPATRSMVVIGHSMGGLLARTLVSDAGDRLWNAAFWVPPGELQVSEEDRRWLVEIFRPAPVPWVRRVVFVATPHRGAELAGGLLGRISSSLVDLPDGYTERIAAIVEANADRIQPAMLEVLADGGPTAIAALSSRHPLILALDDVPIAVDVPFHTIVGNRGRPDAETVSDGFVPLASSHLEGASSERIVPSAHAAYGHPQAIAEIQRILRLHLEERAGTAE